MAVDVAPQRRGAVDVAGPVGRDQVGALAALDDERLLRLPAALLGERMPQMPVVEFRDPSVHPAQSYVDSRSEGGGPEGRKLVARCSGSVI